jgi:hypothetical protein
VALEVGTYLVSFIFYLFVYIGIRDLVYRETCGIKYSFHLYHGSLLCVHVSLQIFNEYFLFDSAKCQVLVWLMLYEMGYPVIEISSF